MTAVSPLLVWLLWAHWLIGWGVRVEHNWVRAEWAGRKHVGLTVCIHVWITEQDLAIKDIKRLGGVTVLSVSMSRGTAGPS